MNLVAHPCTRWSERKLLNAWGCHTWLQYAILLRTTAEQRHLHVHTCTYWLWMSNRSSDIVQHLIGFQDVS